MVKIFNLFLGKIWVFVVVYSGVVSFEIRFSVYYNLMIFDKVVDDLLYFGFVCRMDLGLWEGVVVMKDVWLNVCRVVVLLIIGC